MILVAKIFSYASLLLTIVPSVMVLSESTSDIPYQLLATIGMVVWFATAPLWINKTKEDTPE